MKVVGYVLNDWQVSGVFTAGSSVSSANSNNGQNTSLYAYTGVFVPVARHEPNITGRLTTPARCSTRAMWERVARATSTRSSMRRRSRDRPYGSVGLESGRNVLRTARTTRLIWRCRRPSVCRDRRTSCSARTSSTCSTLHHQRSSDAGDLQQSDAMTLTNSETLATARSIRPRCCRRTPDSAPRRAPAERRASQPRATTTTARSCFRSGSSSNRLRLAPTRRVGSFPTRLFYSPRRRHHA